jgi:dienelactone hydrolase
VRPLAQGLNETTHMTDARAFIGWLDRQSSVARNRKLGTQGYCMGGPIAFRTAAAMPDASARLPRSMAVGWRPTCRTARIFKPRRRRRSSSSKLPRTTTSDRPTRRMF